MHQVFTLTLTAHRTNQGLRLSDAAQMSGLSVPTIRNLEAGKGNLSSLRTYLTSLGLKLHWLGAGESGDGQSLARRRQKLGVSQRAIAQRINVSHRTVIALENDFRGRIDTLDRCLSELRLRPTLKPIGEQPRDDINSVQTDDQLLSVWNASRNDPPQMALLHGDALDVMRSMPTAIVDCIMTSPPYWQQRTYAGGGIGEEQSVEAYLKDLRAVFKQAHRVLKPRGSLWINIDDTYHQRSMQGVPWRLILGMVEDCGWSIRNDVIWRKSGGALNRADNRFGHRHEHLFHLVKQDDYHFDADAVRQYPTLARLDGEVIATATGVTMEACLSRIADATDLNNDERCKATEAVKDAFVDIAKGLLHDFRLIIRGQNRVTHSDSQHTSARATRLVRDGFYLLKYDPRGSLSGDVWTLAPERSKGRDLHYAAYPEALCEKPILATCPIGGVVLDPFVGSGTTLAAAQRLGRHGIGIDLSEEYLKLATDRLNLPN